MSLSENELDSLAGMEAAASQKGSGGDLYSDIDYDGSQVKSFTFVEGPHPFECTDLELFVSQKGDKGLKVTQTAFAGPNVGQFIVDILMLSGKGAGKMANYASAVGMWDAQEKKPIGRYADFLGKRCWGEVKTEENEWQGQIREKSVIPFGGYAPLSKYELPVGDGMSFDEFDEPETVPVEMEPVKPTAKPGRPRSNAGNTPPWPT
jgi:hypothetical protein